MKPISRVKKIIDQRGYSISGFEKATGMSNNSIQIAIKRNANLKDDTINSILNSFPDISPEWLLTGKGSMLRDGTAPQAPAPVVVQAVPDCAPQLAEKERIIEAFQGQIQAKDMVIQAKDMVIQAKDTMLEALQAQVIELQKDKKAMGKNIVLLQSYIDEYIKNPTPEAQKAVLDKVLDFLRGPISPQWALE